MNVGRRIGKRPRSSRRRRECENRMEDLAARYSGRVHLAGLGADCRRGEDALA
jgi:hypothetical protein